MTLVADHLFGAVIPDPLQRIFPGPGIDGLDARFGIVGSLLFCFRIEPDAV